MAPAKAPAKVAVMAPAKVAVMAPAKAPVRVAVMAPAKAPMRVAVMAAKALSMVTQTAETGSHNKTPVAKTLAKVPAENPVKAPVKAPAVMPKAVSDLPNKTPVAKKTKMRIGMSKHLLGGILNGMIALTKILTGFALTLTLMRMTLT